MNQCLERAASSRHKPLLERHNPLNPLTLSTLTTLTTLATLTALTILTASLFQLFSQLIENNVFSTRESLSAIFSQLSNHVGLVRSLYQFIKRSPAPLDRSRRLSPLPFAYPSRGRRCALCVRECCSVLFSAVPSHSMSSSNTIKFIFS